MMKAKKSLALIIICALAAVIDGAGMWVLRWLVTSSSNSIRVWARTEEKECSN